MLGLHLPSARRGPTNANATVILTFPLNAGVKTRAAEQRDAAAPNRRRRAGGRIETRVEVVQLLLSATELTMNAPW